MKLMSLAAAPTGFEAAPVHYGLVGISVLCAVAAIFFIVLPLKGLDMPLKTRIATAAWAGGIFLLMGGLTLGKALDATPTHSERYAAIEHAVAEQAGPKARFGVVEVNVTDPNQAFDAWVNVVAPGEPFVSCLAEFTATQDPTWTCSPEAD